MEDLLASRPFRTSPARLQRSAALVAALLLLLAAVLLGGAGGGSGSGSLPTVPGAAVAILVQVLGWLTLASFFAAVVLGVRGLRRRSLANSEELLTPPPPVHWAIKMVASLAPVLLIAILVALDVVRHPRLPVQGAGGGAGAPSSPLNNLPYLWSQPGVNLLSVAIALAIIGAVALMVWRSAMRSRPDRAEPGWDRPPAAAAVTESLAELRLDGDPRRAVIRAYAAMERSLARHGLARRRAEAPAEYLQRVLTADWAPADDVRALALLFEVAKFSRRPISESMRTDAVGRLSAMLNRLGDAASIRT